MPGRDCDALCVGGPAGRSSATGDLKSSVTIGLARENLESALPTGHDYFQYTPRVDPYRAMRYPLDRVSFQLSNRGFRRLEARDERTCAM